MLRIFDCFFISKNRIVRLHPWHFIRLDVTVRIQNPYQSAEFSSSLPAPAENLWNNIFRISVVFDGRLARCSWGSLPATGRTGRSFWTFRRAGRRITTRHFAG